VNIQAPGCDINIAGLLTDVSAVNAGGTSVLTIPIPNRASLKDASLTFQSGAFAPGANPENLAVSNGGEGVVGWCADADRRPVARRGGTCNGAAMAAPLSFPGAGSDATSPSQRAGW